MEVELCFVSFFFLCVPFLPLFLSLLQGHSHHEISASKSLQFSFLFYQERVVPYLLLSLFAFLCVSFLSSFFSSPPQYSFLCLEQLFVLLMMKNCSKQLNLMSRCFSNFIIVRNSCGAEHHLFFLLFLLLLFLLLLLLFLFFSPPLLFPSP